MNIAQGQAAFRYCVLALDVPRMLILREVLEPHLPRLSPTEAMCALHMARLEMRTCPRKLKLYSRDWLRERGYEKINGQWRQGPPPDVIAEAVGISSNSRVPGLAAKIIRAKIDALNNARAKGITEPEWQKELMEKARQKIRFNGRYI